MPFRDAGYSQADYGLTVQDVVYGVWKAKEEGCCVLETFDLDEYERFERVEQGDFNWITPNFLAFASPQSNPSTRTLEGTEAWNALPKTVAEVEAHPTLSEPFKNVLIHFKERNIGLVVRLNSVLYDAGYFEALGIQHVDMIFDDGTCPPLSMVRKFIRMAHEMITVKKKGIAVHCKAGLGRTGCLIGAYLIYRHGFTANEVISYMRFMRPGMVVGPQQHWLHLNQGTFREWWVEERIERKLRKEAALAAAAAQANGSHPPSTPIRSMQKSHISRSASKNGTSTPPNRSARTPLGEIEDSSRDNNIGVQEEYLPAPTPGQPRKTRRGVDHYHRSSNVPTVEEESMGKDADAEAARAQIESDEEWNARMRARASASASPERRERSVSAYQAQPPIDNDATNDIENIGVSTPRTKSYEKVQRATSASGVLPKVRGSGGSSSAKRPVAAGGVREAGVRKTSGRVGSIGSAPPTAVAARKVSGVH
jgi:cell division cycle 14